MHAVAHPCPPGPCVLVGSVAVPEGTLGSRRSPTRVWMGLGCFGVTRAGSAPCHHPHMGWAYLHPRCCGEKLLQGCCWKERDQGPATVLTSSVLLFHLDPLHGGKDGARGKTDALGHAHVPKHRVVVVVASPPVPCAACWEGERAQMSPGARRAQSWGRAMHPRGWLSAAQPLHPDPAHS